MAGAVIGVFLFSGYIFQTVALKFTTPSKAAFLNGSSAVLVPVLLAVFWRKRINRWAWAGALVAMFGLYFVAVPPSGFRNLNIGDLLSIGSAVMFAFHILAVAHYSTRHSVAGLDFPADRADRDAGDDCVADCCRGRLGSAAISRLLLD